MKKPSTAVNTQKTKKLTDQQEYHELVREPYLRGRKAARDDFESEREYLLNCLRSFIEWSNELGKNLARKNASDLLRTAEDLKFASDQVKHDLFTGESIGNKTKYYEQRAAKLFKKAKSSSSPSVRSK